MERFGHRICLARFADGSRLSPIPGSRSALAANPIPPAQNLQSEWALPIIGRSLETSNIMHQIAAASSSKLVVSPVRTWRDRRAFLRYPWELYRGDPNWIPPLRGDQKELVGYRHHPFYETNRVQTFLARRGGKVCGRVAAILNRDHIEFQHDPRGFFGFFECVDDQEVADGLLDAVRRNGSRSGGSTASVGRPTRASTTWWGSWSRVSIRRPRS